MKEWGTIKLNRESQKDNYGKGKEIKRQRDIRVLGGKTTRV